MPLDSFKDLTVWQRAMDLVKEIYRISEMFPKSENYGLISQCRRSALSIPSNIAEGYKRKNRKEYVQFLGIANGSAGELETQMLLAGDLYSGVNVARSLSLIREVQKMLHSLIKKLS